MVGQQYLELEYWLQPIGDVLTCPLDTMWLQHVAGQTYRCRGEEHHTFTKYPIGYFRFQSLD